MDKKVYLIRFETEKDIEEITEDLVRKTMKAYTLGIGIGAFLGLAIALMLMSLIFIAKPAQASDEIVSNIKNISKKHNIDYKLVLAIAKTESQLNPLAVGRHGEIGLMQVRPDYYVTSFDIKENIKSGIKLLKIAQQRCKHQDDFTFVICYNRGIVGGNRIKWPLQDNYYNKVKANYEN